jgi:hypothetical protein
VAAAVAVLGLRFRRVAVVWEVLVAVALLVVHLLVRRVLLAQQTLVVAVAVHGITALYITVVLVVQAS